MEKIICPICHSDKIKLFGKKNNYKLYRCSDCILVFVYPKPESLDKIYDKDYFKNEGNKRHGYADYDQDKEPMKDVFILYLKKLEKLVTGRNIFDIGAATGYFLDLAKKRNWQTMGVEISSYAAAKAIQKGHKVFTASQLDDLEIDISFDVVTMWDVLEHVPEPIAYLRQVNKIMKSGSVLAINTIDKNSWWAKAWGLHWQMFLPPEHLYYYASKNLDILLKQTGFEILEVKKIGKKFSLAYIFKILYSWQGLKIYQKLSDYFDKSFWRHIAMPINLRDNIFIIAKKNKDV